MGPQAAPACWDRQQASRMLGGGVQGAGGVRGKQSCLAAGQPPKRGVGGAQHCGVLTSPEGTWGCLESRWGGEHT